MQARQTHGPWWVRSEPLPPPWMRGLWDHSPPWCWGDEGDANRFWFAIISNVGAKELTPTERKRIAKYLYNDQEWSQPRIAKALGVSKMTISRDLKGGEGNTMLRKELENDGKSKEPKPTTRAGQVLAAVRQPPTRRQVPPSSDEGRVPSTSGAITST